MSFLPPLMEYEISCTHKAMFTRRVFFVHPRMEAASCVNKHILQTEKPFALFNPVLLESVVFLDAKQEQPIKLRKINSLLS